MTPMKKRKKPLIALAAIVAILLLGRLGLPFLGACLVAEDKPQSSDAMVVLMGGGLERILGAVDLYQDGYADQIWIVRSLVKSYDLARDKGIEIPHETAIIKEAALQSGVPADRVSILPGDATNTQEEAIQVREYLQSRADIESLIIVTSKSHSGRAKKILMKAVRSPDREIRILSCPTPYDDFNAARWWRNRGDLKQGVLEYLKFSYFYLKEQFDL